MELTTLHQRLRVAASDRSYREIGELTATHPETVRRYMHGGAPSVEFLSAFANTMGVSVEWLMTGTGTMRTRDLRGHVLREANVTELLNAMAQTLERLILRVERLEVYVSTLETRLRVAATANHSTSNHTPANHTPANHTPASHTHPTLTSEVEPKPDDHDPVALPPVLPTAATGLVSGHDPADRPPPTTPPATSAPAPTPHPDARAQFIADALPKRARPDDRGTAPAGGA